MFTYMHIICITIYYVDYIPCVMYIIYMHVYMSYLDLLKLFGLIKWFWFHIYPCKQLPPLIRIWTLPFSLTSKHSSNLLVKGYILRTWSNWKSQDSGNFFPLKKRNLFYFSVYDCWLTEILLHNPTKKKGSMY